jgi:hypothetical protein
MQRGAIDYLSRVRKGALLLSSAVALAAFGCSSKSSSTPSTPDYPPIPGAKSDDPGAPRALPSLTLSEREKLCDWSAAIAGGYGHVASCDGGEVVNFKDQATCVGEYLGACTTVTLDQYVTCRRKEATDLCALYMYNSDECAPVVKCLGETDGGEPPPEDSGAE